MACLVFIPVAASAQSSLQNNNSDQQQTGSAQSARGLQTDATAPVQQNNSREVLTQNQPDSLGVVSDPKQTQPSVVVDAANTTNQPSTAATNQASYGWIIVLIVIGIGLFAATYYYYARGRKKDTIAASLPEFIATQPENLPEPAIKPVKKPKTRPKKKKKKAHR